MTAMNTSWYCCSSCLRLWLTFLIVIKGINSLEKEEFPASICSGILCSFQHLEYDAGHNKLYVGALNQVYQLDANLRKEKSAKTGPQEDNERCYPHSPCKDHPTVSTNNFNKLLKIDYDNNRIILCGSIKQGTCDLRELGDVTNVLNEFEVDKDPRSNDFVAGTSFDKSTVAFIANEGMGGREKSLYVGSSMTADDSPLITDDDQFLTFASRRMPKNSKDKYMLSSDFNSNEGSAPPGLLTKKQLSKDGFRVNFISAFEGNRNGYFVLNYPEIKNEIFFKDKIHSYVAQVCLRTENNAITTNSYFEIPISSLSWLGGKEVELNRVIASTTSKVGSELGTALGIKSVAGSQNPDVLFASFATEGQNAGGSTLAMFPLYELDKTYFEMVKSCLNGNKMNHIKWQREKEVPCNKIPIPVKEPLCQNQDIWDVVGLFQSDVTKKGYTIFERNDTIVTSVAVTKLDKHTVVFMGTQDGRIIKLKVDEVPSGKRMRQPYEEIQIDSHTDNMRWRNLGSPRILPDMKFNIDLTKLYAMSERVVVSLPLYDCKKHLTCHDCLSTGDPFCGWCTLKNSCLPAKECALGEYTYARSEPQNCPKLVSTTPTALSVTDPSIVVQVTIRNIPRPEVRGQYECDFGGKHRSKARFFNSYVNCESPPKSQMPKLNGQEVSVPLALIFNKNDGGSTMIASSEIVFYDCANFKSCLPCLMDSGRFNCHWCTNDNECTQTRNACKTTPGVVNTRSDCPALLEVIGVQHLHVGEKRSIGLRAENLPTISGELQQGFKCSFDIDGKMRETVNATHTNEKIVCGTIKGFLPANVYEAKARISVHWSQNFIIDNEKNLNVTMYKCSRGAEDNCGKCLMLDQDLRCGWCESKEECALDINCSGGRKWLDQNEVCRNPKITDFNPKSAAPGGVTRITIEGENLGKDPRMLEGGISVAGEPCEVQSEGYESSEKVICIVRDVADVKEGVVTLCINKEGQTGACKGSDYRFSSSQKFMFVQPTLGSFSPMEGLNAGGTNITFKGKHLDIGNNVSVFIHGRSCLVGPTVTSTSFSCKLACDTTRTRSRRRTRLHHHLKSRSNRSRRYALLEEVKVVFDQKAMDFTEFRLEQDVRFQSLSPRESITSGGMRLKVTGSNLHLAQTMVLRISSGIHAASRECEPAGENKVVRDCMSPGISGYPLGNYSGQLILDECLTLDIGSIKYTEDPFLDQFDDPDHVYHHQSGPIIITGRNLCPNPLKCDVNSVRVEIGDSLICNVTSIDKDKLVCVPPEGSGGKHEVVVFIGDYHQPVGKLEFDGNTPLIWIVIVIVCIVIAVIIFVCINRRRANKNSQTVKQLQMQLDMMEAKVAKECKEAFAELQTDMQSDLDNLGTVGIPFRKRHDYIMRVLFPDPEMYDRLNQSMHTPYVDGNSRFNHHNGRGAPHRAGSVALEGFDKLLESKPFLLIFIRTLERQRKFTMKDKGNVAGLLMIVLQNRLQYATQILEELLADLIRNSLESRSHPKLLLRRTESVAEKLLTHWFSILLHGFLLDCAGEPLFMLFRAIKAQLDKGPIDAITGEAKYSLSEDKLLRQAVNYENLVLMVMENDSNDQPLQANPVKVLDCDTISQTKEKIIALKFRHQPNSAHPDPDDFDLEMDQDPLGRVILNDEDNTSEIEGGWKKINTLLHYKVKDRTRVAMVTKRGPFNQSGVNPNHSFGSRVGGMRYNGSGHRLINEVGSLPRYIAGQGSRSTTPTIIDDGKKLYHLSKQHDSEPKDGGSDVGNKMASEIYLTRLLATKGTIQKFVDDLFETIFSVVQRGHALPPAIKHMYDFLDEQASYHGIVDTDVVHAWKSNCLPLRFWVNLIKNPQFLFDIKKSPLVDSCLTVIGQTFMDSCSKSDHVLGKDSPSNKLLYAKDIPNYKEWVKKYYDDISAMEPIDQQDMKCFLDDESGAYRSNHNSQAALTQLYLYVQKYSNEIIEALNGDPTARSQRLAQRLEQVATAMTSTV